MLAAAASADRGMLAMLLVDVALIAGCALLLGGAARKLGQAVVLGELVAGVLLGPSLLGLLPGDVPAWLFPGEVRPYLSALAQLALVLFMFGVGYEVSLSSLRRMGINAGRITLASMAIPCAAAVAVGPVLLAAYPPPLAGVTAVQSVAFLAIVLSVTAFPVLARMLTDFGYATTQLGRLALLIAAATDMIAWVALAVLTATLGSDGASPLGVLAAALVAFVAVLIIIVRPTLRTVLRSGWCERPDPQEPACCSSPHSHCQPPPQPPSDCIPSSERSPLASRAPATARSQARHLLRVQRARVRSIMPRDFWPPPASC